MFPAFAKHIRDKYDAEAGFITMNMPLLVDVLERVGVQNPIVCANINKIGFRMSGGVDAYRELLRSNRLPLDRDVGLRVRRDPAARGHRVGVRPRGAARDRLWRLVAEQHSPEQGAHRARVGLTPAAAVGRSEMIMRTETWRRRPRPC